LRSNYKPSSSTCGGSTELGKKGPYVPPGKRGAIGPPGISEAQGPKGIEGEPEESDMWRNVAADMQRRITMLEKIGKQFKGMENKTKAFVVTWKRF